MTEEFDFESAEQDVAFIAGSLDGTIYDLPLYRRCREAGGSKEDCKEGAANPAEAWPGA